MELAALSWAIGTLMMRLTITLPTEGPGRVDDAADQRLPVGAGAGGRADTQLSVQPRHVGQPGVRCVHQLRLCQIIWFGLAQSLPPATSAMSVMAIGADRHTQCHHRGGRGATGKFVAVVLVMSAIHSRAAARTPEAVGLTA